MRVPRGAEVARANRLCRNPVFEGETFRRVGADGLLQLLFSRESVVMRIGSRAHDRAFAR